MANLKSKIYRDAASLAKNVDLLLVFGGDGTMLRAASEIAGSTTPILGINLGGLGFLTAVSSNEIENALKRILRGEYEIESRALIQVDGRCSEIIISKCALNDFVISRGIISKLITLEVSVDGQLLTRYRCDGLIVSSPTGSTAYALSSGGAVVHPSADVFELTPICPHTLSNRSVIVSLNSTIQVRVVSPKPDIILSADGEMVSEMLPGETVTIRRSADSVRLLHLPGYSFFDTLRRKLNWSGANV
ncbi:ATP-NAD/AcoX kinase [Pedosphaera parvula Ellin514]|uniref:NAD kinase n=2 Tax=Pedosphaera TaxID=1032526 RepID=B9XMS4_PEDPL|nr:ATP-NAD/AcoX kinase [Pedosphaera parvula Ellin514]